MQIHNPAELVAPSTYSHGIEAQPGARILFISGQVGWDSTGIRVGSGVAEQTEMAFENLRAVLLSARMSFSNVVKTTVFLVNPEDYSEFAKARTRILGEVKPASTLVYVKQLIRPELLVEVEAIAIAGGVS